MKEGEQNMGWKMDSHGNWTKTGSNRSSGSEKVSTDKGNTSDTNSAIASIIFVKVDI